MNLYQKGIPYWREVIDNNEIYFSQYLDLIINRVNQNYITYKTREKELQNIEYINPGYTKDDFLGALSHENGELEQILYRSFITSVYFFIEGKISNLCDHIYKIQQEKFRYNELNGMGIERCIKYIKKTTGCNFPNDKNLYTDLNILRIIRNSFAHSNGAIKDNERSTIRKYLKTKSLFKLEKNFTINLNLIYCKKLIYINRKIIGEISDMWRVPDSEFTNTNNKK